MTTSITDFVAHHGIVAVAVLMAIDALLPALSELTMLLAGALVAGAIGHGTGGLGTGAGAYAALAGAGTLGNTAGAVVGWWIGRWGGRELLARHGRWLHLGPERLEGAEQWFAGHGRAAVLLGRVTPVVRSFVSVPAGALGAPLASYVALTVLGSAIWCFGLAAAGWALGSGWQRVNAGFGYADLAAVVGAGGLGWLLVRRWARTR